MGRFIVGQSRWLAGPGGDHYKLGLTQIFLCHVNNLLEEYRDLTPRLRGGILCLHDDGPLGRWAPWFEVQERIEIGEVGSVVLSMCGGQWQVWSLPFSPQQALSVRRRA